MAQAMAQAQAMAMAIAQAMAQAVAMAQAMAMVMVQVMAQAMAQALAQVMTQAMAEMNFEKQYSIRRNVMDTNKAREFWLEEKSIVSGHGESRTVMQSVDHPLLMYYPNAIRVIQYQAYERLKSALKEIAAYEINEKTIGPVMLARDVLNEL